MTMCPQGLQALFADSGPNIERSHSSRVAVMVQVPRRHLRYPLLGAGKQTLQMQLLYAEPEMIVTISIPY